MYYNFVKLMQISVMVVGILGFTDATYGATDEPIKNLSNVDYFHKQAVSDTINQLFYDANKSDAYSLSLPLIADAQQGDVSAYTTVHETMAGPLNDLPNDAFKAWMLGRALLAADSIGDTATVASLTPELENFILTFNSTDYTSDNYAFYAWACGYLAAINQDEYQTISPRMLDSMQHLIDLATATDDHAVTANTMWALVMDLQAAANAHDMQTYQQILSEMLNVSHSTNISAALEKTLIRTSTSSDYPAWAMAIVELAAATVHDSNLYRELTSPLIREIYQAQVWAKLAQQNPANQWKAHAEASLARLNQVLAQQRYKAD